MQCQKDEGKLETEGADRKIRDRKMETGNYRCRRLACFYFSVLHFSVCGIGNSKLEPPDPEGN
jgi:hypothetical protein